MKKIKAKKQESLLDKYKKRTTKGNIENTLIKSSVDVVSASVVGTSIAAIMGNKAPLVGILIIGAGHYLGDDTGHLRVTGASVLAYGIAKSKDYKSNSDLQSVSARLKNTKEDFLSAFNIDWSTPKEVDKSIIKEKSGKEKIVKEGKVNSKEDKQDQFVTVEKEDNQSVDGDFDIGLSALDSFEIENETMADSFEEEKRRAEDISSIDDSPDLSLI